MVAWYTSVFLAVFLIRDFNWRGHGGNHASKGKKLGWEFDDKSNARNQFFYGYFASEWHDNHHKYPSSAKNGFLQGQPDLAFQIIKFLSKIGVIESYVDMSRMFKEQILSPISAPTSKAEKDIECGASSSSRTR